MERTISTQQQPLQFSRRHPQQRSRRVVAMSASRSYSCSVSRLWEAAGDPRNVSSDVPMLRSFDLADRVQRGAHTEEVHTILGWPQRYAGRILNAVEGKFWSMTSSPVGAGPFPLAHTVAFRFAEREGGHSTLTIACRCEPGALLRVWPCTFVIRWYLARTLRHILLGIDQVLRQSSGGR